MAKQNFNTPVNSATENDDIIERIRLLEQGAKDIAEGVSTILDDKFNFKCSDELSVFDLEFTE